MSAAEPVDLQTAATELGVHYQTAYRWVRTQRLTATLVGGRYLVQRDDLEEFRRRRKQPKQPTPPSTSRVERQADAVHGALLAGDEPKVRDIVGRLVGDGLGVVDLVTDVISPSLREIGRAWHDGEIDIWVEHRASAIVERALGDVVPNPRGRRRGTAAVAAVTGDRHGLPTTMATAALRSSNWNVHHLGADTPPASIRSFVSEHELDLVVLSNTNPDVEERTRQTADELRAAGVSVLVGRPGASLHDLVADANALNDQRPSA